jgi:hypothetical protein
MSEETIVTDQAGEEERNESAKLTENLACNRRDFLQKTMAMASGLALTSMLPGFAREPWNLAAQSSKCLAAGQALQSIMEIKSAGTGPTKTLKAVLKVLD